MIYAGIDIAKDKHDCLITDSDGVVLFAPFTIPNNRCGFETLFDNLKSCSEDFSNKIICLPCNRTSCCCTEVDNSVFDTVTGKIL